MCSAVTEFIYGNYGMDIPFKEGYALNSTMLVAMLLRRESCIFSKNHFKTGDNISFFK